jgi:dihydroflavonol-4-reductase
MLLLTGAGGFIGGHLLEQLRISGTPVRRLARRGAAAAPGVETRFADFESGEGLEAALEGVEAVIHLAGVTKALRPEDYDRGNVRATEALLGAVGDRPGRFVHVSSMAAVGPGSMLAEDAEPRPVSLYGRSKLAAERAVRAIRPDAVIVRPPVVYGPRDTDVFQVLKTVAKGVGIEIAGGERWFSAIFVKDLARALLLAARHPKAPGRTYFLAHPEPATWRELAAIAARLMGRKPPRSLKIPFPAAYAFAACVEAWARIRGKPEIVSRDKLREARYNSWTCDPGRAAAELGFEAPTSLETGLAETLDWYRNAGWLIY